MKKEIYHHRPTEIDVSGSRIVPMSQEEQKRLENRLRIAREKPARPSVSPSLSATDALSDLAARTRAIRGQNR